MIVYDEKYHDLGAVGLLADRLLAKIVEVYAESETPLPARRYKTVGGQGDTVHDGEQVTVSWEQGYSGLPGAQSLTPVTRTEPRSAVYVAEIVRKIPGLSPKGLDPTPAAISAAADLQMKDAQLLMEAGMRTAEQGWNKKGIVDVSAGKPSGKVQAIILSLVVALE